LTHTAGIICKLSVRKHSPEIVTIPAHLELSEPPIADCARYDRFRKEAGHLTYCFY